MKRISVNVLDLYLDNKNPRHDPINDRKEIINYLVQNEKIKVLAKSIAENGTSPLESLAVMENENGHFIALEGNRRVCALTLLNDPELCPENERSYFRKLSGSSDFIPEVIECILFSNRDEANKWIELRHNGEQDGAGLLTWNATQKTRYFGSSDNTLALKLLDYAETKGYITKQKRDGVLTTASRFLGNPVFRTTLGIKTGRSDPNVLIDVSRDDFDTVLERFINDLINSENNVTSRSKKDDWENYAKKLRSEGIAPKGHCEPEDLFNKENNNDKKETITNKKASNNQSPNNRKYIVPSDFKVNIPDPILKRVFDELRTLDCSEYTLASSVVCRAFLENIYSLTYEKLYGNYPEGMLEHIVMEKIINKIESVKSILTKNEKKALEALKRVKTDTTNPLSPKTLGANAHAGFYPDPTALKVHWDNISYILLFMLNKIFTNDSVH
ncbi:hypothetical protein MF265_01755 [Serratia marcescens]|uniref:hypothetical protein n=1 Tax=Serratia marcescens TaxID=615 RepID=UPI001EF062BF|nr:hypothetical protein [Serratia marcescens]ULH11547.1 hypothetical protein MF265_01755 [Serratia marcescens]